MIKTVDSYLEDPHWVSFSPTLEGGGHLAVLLQSFIKNPTLQMACLSPQRGECVILEGIFFDISSVSSDCM